MLALAALAAQWGGQVSPGIACSAAISACEGSSAWPAALNVLQKLCTRPLEATASCSSSALIHVSAFDARGLAYSTHASHLGSSVCRLQPLRSLILLLRVHKNRTSGLFHYERLCAGND